jgi:hypothetical protein
MSSIGKCSRMILRSKDSWRLLMSSQHYILIEIDPHAYIFLNKIANHHIVQLPSNHILKGLVPLERLFDRNDVAVKGKVSNKDVEVAECNIGTEKEPKFVKFSSSLTRKQRAEYVELLK